MLHNPLAHLLLPVQILEALGEGFGPEELVSKDGRELLPRHHFLCNECL
jgi:hypothetical protein